MSPVLRFASRALLLLCLVFGLSQQAFAAGDGFPGPVPPTCGAFYPGDCLITTRLGALTISPHIVRAGEAVTGTIAAGCVIGYGNNDPCPVGWTSLTALGKVRAGCDAHSYTCEVVIPRDAASSDYQAINVTVTNAQGAGYSSDYLAIAGKDEVKVSGRVTDRDSGAALAGITVRASCGGSGATDPHGEYSLYAAKGSCTVAVDTPVGESAVPAKVELVLHHDVSGVDFRIVQKKIDISGVLTSPVCDDRHSGDFCQDEPVEGVPVTATWTTSGGTTDSETRESDKKGKWSLKVEKGLVKVSVRNNEHTPREHDWTSSACSGSTTSCSLTVRGPRNGIDFSSCEIDNWISGWHFEGDCPSTDDGAWQNGADDVRITPPDATRGWLTLPAATDPYPLAVTDQDHRYELALPLELPDFSVAAGGASVGVSLVTLDKAGTSDAGVRIGVGGFQVGPLDGGVEDLNPTDGSVGDLELAVNNPRFGVSFQATNARYHDSTFTAARFALGLPPLLGGGTVYGNGLSIGSGGVHATIDGGHFSVAGATVEVREASATSTQLSVKEASIELPAYLGSGTLAVRDLKYDFATGALSGEASGNVHIAIARRFDAAIDAKLTLKDGRWQIAGDGMVDVTDPGGRHLFSAAAGIDIASVNCPAVPGPCEPPAGDANGVPGAFLQRASLEIRGKAVPLGETGLELDGLGAEVKSSGVGSIDASGHITGVNYVFTGKAHVATIDGELFQGTVGLTLSTDGNLALSLENATALKDVLHLKGSVCVIQSLPDDVCNGDDSSQSAPPPPDATGVFFNGSLSADVHANVRLCRFGLALAATADGRLNPSHPRLSLSQGRLAVDAGCDLLGFPGLHTEATLTNTTLGRFAKQGGSSQLGIMGTLDGTATIGSTTREEHGSFFIGADGTLITKGAGQYHEVGGAGPAVDSRAVAAASPIAPPFTRVPSPLEIASPGRGAVAVVPTSAEGLPGSSTAADRLGVLHPMASAPAPTPSKNWRSVPGTGGCGYGVELTGEGQTARSVDRVGHASPALPLPEINGIPVLVVKASDGPCVAANIYSALTGTDPVTGQPAVTPNRANKQYGVFSGNSAWDLLHYSVVADNKNTSNDNRSKACGWDPFKSGRRPGPVDAPGSLYVSCDEFPFASTREGGSTAIVRGTTLADNVGQGRLLGRFYDLAFPKMEREDSPGAFYVCVQYPGRLPAGMCPP